MIKIALISILALASLGAASSDSGAKSSTGWQIPFSTPHRLVRQYLQPTSDYSAGHRGVDYEAKVGEILYAPADGVVSVSKVIVNRGIFAITHGAALVSELEPVCSDLPAGTSVRKGQEIARVCAPQDSYLKHCSKEFCLHFSLRHEGKYLSPLALIGGLNPSRLLSYARG